jgi:hypothetical protein
VGIHDIDEPAEVIAAADRYRTAATEVTDQVGGTVRRLAPPRRAASSLDRELEARLDSVTNALGQAVTQLAARVAATHRSAVEAARALGDADQEGAERIRDAGLD